MDSELLRRLRDRSPRDLVSDARYAGALVAVFGFALWIRLIPKQGMERLQALDPYMIARMSHAIATGGSLPLFDAWRYFPYTTPTFLFNLGDIFIPAYLYQLAAPFMDFLTWTQVYPAIAGALMVVAMYFAGKEMFGRRAGLLAAFFLAASPAVLHRSSAGWFEKEPLAAFLMISSIYFVTRAWKRTSWPSGIAAGAALGIALTVWGGAKFLVLLYPVILFPVAFIDEDIEGLLAAFSPAILVGHLLPAILNPSRFGVPSGPFVFSLGVLGIVWARYLAGAYEVVDDAHLGYVIPGLSALGGVLMFLSPLYSQALAEYALAFIHKATQSGGGVIAGTVAENQAARAGQIVGQIGAFQSTRVLPDAVAVASEFFSGWTFSLIGTGLLLAVLGGMLVRKYTGREEVPRAAAYAAFGVTFPALILGLLLMLPGNPLDNATAFLFAILTGGTGAALLFLLSMDDADPVTLPQQWYLVIPLLWILSTLYGATQKSRLLFLTAQPVALMAGYGLSTGISAFERSSFREAVRRADTDIEAERVYRAVLVLVLVPVVLFNGAAAYGMAQGIGGSPNQAWMENLEFMREETPVDSVVLSWWDYGYWFESIGARAAIADGGNLGFYAQPGEGKINLPLADFLTAANYTKHLDWLDSLSVDYVVLDSTMIGKYSAVSQIHHRSNTEFNAMQTFGCRSRDQRCLTTSAQNRTYLMYQDRGRRLLVPFSQEGGDISIDGTPLMQTRRGTAAIANVCSEDGVREVDIPENQTAIPGCVAFHPHRQHQTLVYIPEEVMDSTLVELYIMDAHGMEHFDEVFDNGFVKMWKIDYDT
ncbi:MAG: STT3 domain-containing protein [Candidatus Nanohaloarchaea archaeon]|nr:STT3 domain-containing protein [Candidatus Nanohaloarchaea archaeon]